jgi:hypothetical protein
MHYNAVFGGGKKGRARSLNAEALRKDLRETEKLEGKAHARRT